MPQLDGVKPSGKKRRRRRKSSLSSEDICDIVKATMLLVKPKLIKLFGKSAPMSLNRRMKTDLAKSIAESVLDALDGLDTRPVSAPAKEPKKVADHSRLAKMFSADRPVTKYVLADFCASNGKLFKYRDTRDALVSLFKFKPYEFWGLTPDGGRCCYSLLVSEVALKRLLVSPPLPFGTVTPWSSADLFVRPHLALMIGNKLANQVNNSAQRRVGRTLLGALVDKNDSALQQFIFDGGLEPSDCLEKGKLGP